MGSSIDDHQPIHNLQGFAMQTTAEILTHGDRAQVMFFSSDLVSSPGALKAKSVPRSPPLKLSTLQPAWPPKKQYG